MKKGVTLIEVAIVLMILGLVATAAFPALGSLRDRLTVQAVAAEISSAHTRARIRSILEGQVTELDVRPDSLILTVVSRQGPTQVWGIPGPLASGAALLSPPRKLIFVPTGVTSGFANATFVITRGSARRQVVVSRLGRVRIIP